MQHVWSIICSNSVIDVRTNNISLFNALERIVFSLNDEDIDRLKSQFDGNLPVPISAEFVTMWVRSDLQTPEISMGRLIVVTPDNNTYIIYEAETDLTISPRRRHIHVITGFLFDGNGFYHFLVQTLQDEEWITVADIPLEIIHEPPQETE